MTGELKTKIKKLEEDIQDMKKNGNYVRSISDSAATEVLKDEIRRLKEKGIRGADVIDLHFNTNLPLGQIAGIMVKLEREGIVKEDGTEE